MRIFSNADLVFDVWAIHRLAGPLPLSTSASWCSQRNVWRPALPVPESCSQLRSKSRATDLRQRFWRSAARLFPLCCSSRRRDIQRCKIGGHRSHIVSGQFGNHRQHQFRPLASSLSLAHVIALSHQLTEESSARRPRSTGPMPIRSAPWQIVQRDRLYQHRSSPESHPLPGCPPERKR